MVPCDSQAAMPATSAAVIASPQPVWVAGVSIALWL